MALRQTALITGGTRGIGLGVAAALAEDGWDLALCGRRAAGDVEDTLRALRTHGGGVEYWPADVASAGDRTALIDAMTAHYGVPHALVNNAGRAPRVRADVLDADETSFEELIRTNLQGPHFLTQAIAKLMIEARAHEAQRSAAIVFITSVSAEMASPNRGEYCVSKAGLAMSARLFAARLAVDRIPVFDVRPGIIETDMTAKVRDVYDRRIADGLVPEGRWGTPADVGRVVRSLLRGDLPYATGSVIHVDGGLTIPRL